MKDETFVRAQLLKQDIETLRDFLSSYEKPYADKNHGCISTPELNDVLNGILRAQHKTIARKAAEHLKKLELEFSKL